MATWLLLACLIGCGARGSSTPSTPSTNGGSRAGGASSTQSAAGSPADAGSVAANGSNASSGAGSGAAGVAGAGGAHAAGSGGRTESFAAGSGGDSALAAGGGAGAASAGDAAHGCGSAGLLFCDDFEVSTTAGMPPPAPKWSIALNGMGSVAIDASTAAHSGTKSVHVSSNGGYQTFFALTGAPIFPAPGPLYLRLYIRLGAAMSAGHNTYYKAGAAGMPSSDHETRVGVMNAMLMINQPASDRGFLSNQNYYNDGNKPGVVFAPLTWTCVEALFDPEHTTFDIWVDGKEVPDLHRTDWQQDALGSFHFGFEKYAGPDADIWYDDIAVSAMPIGCK
jgi:hypothetical protein